MHRVGQSFWSRFSDQQMHVFGHDNIAVNPHLEAQSHAFEAFDKEVVDVRRCELAVPLITTEGEEVRLAGFVESFQSACHVEHYMPDDHPVSVTAQVSAKVRREPGAPGTFGS